MYVFFFIFICILFFIFMYMTHIQSTDKVFFELGVYKNAKIVLHKPSIIKVFEFKNNFSHYITTLDIDNTAYVFYRESNADSDRGLHQKTKLITSKDGLNFSVPITVFDTMPQAHNFAPFIDKNELMAIGGGYNGEMKLYKSIMIWKIVI